eukprot:8946507-Pyramimonas_sp.AAC.1
MACCSSWIFLASLWPMQSNASSRLRRATEYSRETSLTANLLAAKASASASLHWRIFCVIFTSSTHSPLAWETSNAK